MKKIKEYEKKLRNKKKYIKKYRKKKVVDLIQELENISKDDEKDIHSDILDVIVITQC